MTKNNDLHNDNPQYTEAEFNLNNNNNNHFIDIWEAKTRLMSHKDCNLAHYGDVVMGVIASPITSLTIVYSIVYSGANQRNIKAPRHWPLCVEFTGDWWIPRTNGQ